MLDAASAPIVRRLLDERARMRVRFRRDEAALDAALMGAERPSERELSERWQWTRHEVRELLRPAAVEAERAAKRLPEPRRRNHAATTPQPKTGPGGAESQIGNHAATTPQPRDTPSPLPPSLPPHTPPTHPPTPPPPHTHTPRASAHEAPGAGAGERMPQPEPRAGPEQAWEPPGGYACHDSRCDWPAGRIWQAVWPGATLHPHNARVLHARLGTDPDRLHAFHDACLDWLDSGYNPRNVEQLLANIRRRRDALSALDRPDDDAYRSPSARPDRPPPRPNGRAGRPVGSPAGTLDDHLAGTLAAIGLGPI